MASEKNFENRIKSFLKSNNCYFIKYWGGGEFTKAGVPDILACCNGKFLGIEVKAKNGKPSPLMVLMRVVSVGIWLTVLGIVFVISAVAWCMYQQSLFN